MRSYHCCFPQKTIYTATEILLQQMTQNRPCTGIREQDLAENRSNLLWASQTWTLKSVLVPLSASHIQIQSFFFFFQNYYLISQFGKTCFPQKTCSQEKKCSPLQMSLLHQAAFSGVNTPVQHRHASKPNRMNTHVHTNMSHVQRRDHWSEAEQGLLINPEMEPRRLEVFTLCFSSFLHKSGINRPSFVSVGSYWCDNTILQSLFHQNH